MISKIIAAAIIIAIALSIAMGVIVIATMAFAKIRAILRAEKQEDLEIIEQFKTARENLERAVRETTAQ